MNKLGLIAGEGKFPLHIAKEAKKMRIHINDLKDELERYEKYMNNFKEGKFTLNF